MTNISSKEELITFLSNSWIVPTNAKLNEEITAKLYNTNPIVWTGEGGFPLANLQWSKSQWHQYQISSLSSVMYIPGNAQPTSMGNFNNILNSNSTNKTSSFIWNTSFNTEGTYSLNLILNFSDGSSYTIERSIVISRDIIARATSTVSNGRSETRTVSLYPYTVYEGHYISNNKIKLDVANITFDASEIEDAGWNVGDEIAIYTYPTNIVENLLSDMSKEGDVIDVDNGISIAIIKEFGQNTVLMANVEGSGVYYDGTPIELNGNSYYWFSGNSYQNTDTLQYTANHSRSDLIPGHTYQINAEYLENNKYSYNSDVGELEMLKCPTTTTISANPTVTVGENLTVNINVVEGLNNTSLSRGYVTIYDGNQVIQSNHAVTGNNTQITFNSNVPGTHDIYAIFTDSGVEYNTSVSNHLSVIVEKIDTKVVIDEINSMSGEFNIYQNTNTTFASYADNVRMNIPMNTPYLIKGRVVDSNNNPIPECEVELENISNYASDSNGVFEIEFTADSSQNQQNIAINYSGTNQYNYSSSSLFVNCNYLPKFTGLTRHYDSNNRISFLIPSPNLDLESQHIPELMQIIDLYDYVGYTCNLSGAYIESNHYYQEYGENELSDNYLYFIGFIDPSLVENEDDIYMYVASVAINSNHLQDIAFYYDGNAQEQFVEICNYFPELETEFTTMLGEKGWEMPQ